MQEIWKDIKDYEGYYQVSNLGNVRSIDRYVENGNHTQFRNGKEKRQWKNTDGYLIVKLSKNNRNVNIPVHMLVAQTFIDNRTYNDGWEVNHKDSNRINNNVNNLEWVTHKENIEHAAKKGHMKRYAERNSNYNNHTLKNKYKQNPELTVCCSRPGKENGRARSIKMINIKTSEEKIFDYIKECSQYLIENHLLNNKNVNGLSTIIRKHAESNKPYKGMLFYLQ